MSQTFIGTVIGFKSFIERATLSGQPEENKCGQCNGDFHEKSKQNEVAVWEIRGVKDKIFCSRKCVGEWLKTHNSQGIRAKTITVKYVYTELHPKYHKQIKKEKDYQVHNEKYDLKLGDKVVIESCRPRSKTKRFLVVEKIGVK